MYPYYYRLLHGLPSPSFEALTLSGYSGQASSDDEADDPDRPELICRQLPSGGYQLSEANGGSGEWMTAEATLDLDRWR